MYNAAAKSFLQIVLQGLDSLWLSPASFIRRLALLMLMLGARMSPQSQSLEGRRIPTLKGDRVAFVMSAAFIPDSEAIRETLSDAREVEGTVVSFSDSGSVPEMFALVEVIHKQVVVVPVNKLRLVGHSNANET